jgi:hypothetical protein
MVFNKFPHEINRHIGSFLDYNSRIEFSRILTSNKDKFVRKLKSDEHEFYIAKETVLNYMKTLRRYRENPKKRVYLYQFFKYLLNDRNTILLDVENQYEVFMLFHFKKRILCHARELMDPMSGNYGHIMTKKQRKEMISISSKLVEKYENYVPKRVLYIQPNKIEIN